MSEHTYVPTDAKAAGVCAECDQRRDAVASGHVAQHRFEPRGATVVGRGRLCRWCDAFEAEPIHDGNAA